MSDHPGYFAALPSQHFISGAPASGFPRPPSPRGRGWEMWSCAPCPDGGPAPRKLCPTPPERTGQGGDALLLLEVRGASIAVGGSLLFSERSNEESPIRQSGSPFLLQLTLSPVPRRPLLAFRSPLNSNRLSGCLPVVGWRLRGAPQRWGPALCQSYPPGAGAPSQSWEAGGMRLVPLFSPTGGSSWEMGIGC